MSSILDLIVPSRRRHDRPTNENRADMTEILVIVPVLNRPQRALLVAQSLAEATVRDYRLVFVCSPDDDAEVDACTRVCAHYDALVMVVDWQPGHGDWARKINAVYTQTSEPFLLLGADDLVFHPGWDTAALELAHAGFGVIGTNDLGNPTVQRGIHSTHPLVSRAYAGACGTVDECDKILHEGYRHNWVDAELVETAKQRGAWAFAAASRVEHFHPFWGKAQDDATYLAGREHYAADARLFQARRRLWEAVAA